MRSFWYYTRPNPPKAAKVASCRSFTRPIRVDQLSRYIAAEPDVTPFYPHLLIFLSQPFQRQPSLFKRLSISPEFALFNKIIGTFLFLLLEFLSTLLLFFTPPTLISPQKSSFSIYIDPKICSEPEKKRLCTPLQRFRLEVKKRTDMEE